MSHLPRSTDQTTVQMIKLCKQLLADKTVILVTHDPRDAQDWFNEVMVLTPVGLKGPFDLGHFKNDHTLIQVLDGEVMSRVLAILAPMTLLITVWWFDGDHFRYSALYTSGT